MRGPIALAIALLAVATGPAAAQEGALARADSLARAGEADRARAVLLAWMDEGMAAAEDGEVEHARWLRALLTVDPAQARLDLIRITAEHPAGRWADRALLRLGHLARLREDEEAAVRRFRTLLRDYPASEVRDRAEAALRSLGAPPDGVDVGPPAPGADRSPPADGGDVAIQLGAFETLARAEALREEAEAAGLDVRVVRIPGSALVRVRIGRFVDRAAAAGELRRVRGEGFDAIVVAGARREEPAGGAGSRPGPG